MQVPPLAAAIHGDGYLRTLTATGRGFMAPSSDARLDAFQTSEHPEKDFTGSTAQCAPVGAVSWASGTPGLALLNPHALIADVLLAALLVSPGHDDEAIAGNANVPFISRSISQ